MSPSRKTSGRLTARSVVASVLLGTDPPWLPTGLLVRTAALFGMSEGTTRTALSRMVAAGEAVAEGGGYRLAGRLVARQARQTASRHPNPLPWDGTWEVATVDGDGRRSAADRAALREALHALRLVEVREGAWARPDNLDPDRSPEARAVARQQCRWWRGSVPDPAPEPGDLWDLTGWAAVAANLRADMGALLDDLEAGRADVLADGFVTSAAVLRHLQADPLLPEPLLPSAWPGPELRAEYDRYDAAYRAVLGAWFSADH